MKPSTLLLPPRARTAYYRPRLNILSIVLLVLACATVSISFVSLFRAQHSLHPDREDLPQLRAKLQWRQLGRHTGADKKTNDDRRGERWLAISHSAPGQQSWHATATLGKCVLNCTPIEAWPRGYQFLASCDHHYNMVCIMLPCTPQTPHTVLVCMSFTIPIL